MCAARRLDLPPADIADTGLDAGEVWEHAGLWDRALDAYAAGGDVVRTAASSNAVGEVLLVLERAAEAHERFTDALRAWRGARSPRGVAEVTPNPGVAALHDGDRARRRCR